MKYFKPLNAINCGIGGDKVQNVLWRCNNLPSSPSIQNVVIMCGTNNINHDSVEDIVDGIIDVVLSFKNKFHHCDIFVCGIIPRDENWSINRVHINEINNYLRYKCNLFNTKFLDQIDWTLLNGSLNPEYFYSDKLHLIEKGNTKLAELIYKSINPNISYNNNASISTKLFISKPVFNLNQEDFPPLPCSRINVRKHVRPVSWSNPVRPVNYNNFIHTVSYSKPVCSVNHGKPVCSVHHSKPVRPVSYSNPVRPVNHSKPVRSSW